MDELVREARAYLTWAEEAGVRILAQRPVPDPRPPDPAPKPAPSPVPRGR